MGLLVLAVALQLSAAPAPKADPFEWKGGGPTLAPTLSLRELTLWRNDLYARARNPFRKAWLDRWFRQFDWYHPAAQMDVKLLDAEAIAHANQVAELEASLTRDQLLGKASVLRTATRDRSPTPEEEVEARLLSVRLGQWVGPGAPPADLTPLEDPRQLEQVVTLKQLEDLSPRDLKLLRETVRARRGFSFDDPDLAGHFRTASWYRPAPKPALSRLDRANIRIIESVLATLHQPEPVDLLPKPLDLDDGVDLVGATAPGADGALHPVGRAKAKKPWRRPARFYGWG